MEQAICGPGRGGSDEGRMRLMLLLGVFAAALRLAASVATAADDGRSGAASCSDLGLAKAEGGDCDRDKGLCGSYSCWRSLRLTAGAGAGPEIVLS